MTKEWAYPFKIDVLNVINHCDTNGLTVGLPELQTCEMLGEKDISPKIVNKKFKMIFY